MVKSTRRNAKKTVGRNKRRTKGYRRTMRKRQKGGVEDGLQTPELKRGVPKLPRVEKKPGSRAGVGAAGAAGGSLFADTAPLPAIGLPASPAPQFPDDPFKITVPAQKVNLPKTKTFRPINVAVEGGERWWGGRGMFLVTIQDKKGGEKQFNVSAGAAESALLLS